MTSIDPPVGDPAPHRPDSTIPPAVARTLSSKEIFHGGHEVLIDHEGEIYRLRLTRNGKLILQK